MRVLIVGSRSAISRAVATEFEMKGAQVVMAGRNGAEVALDLSTVLPGTLCDNSGRPLRCDLVINAAGIVGGADPALEANAWRVNAKGAGAVARLAIAVGARQMIQLSTVYAGCPECYPGHLSYPRSKAAGEAAAAEEVRRGGLALTVLRLTHVYDATGACRPNQELPYRFADLAEANQPIEIHGDGTARRDYLYLDDATRAVWLAATSNMTGTMNICSPGMLTISEIARAAQREFRSTSRVLMRTDVPGPASMPPLDPDCGWRALGGAPTVGLAEGFARMRLERAA